jgi:thiamine pyrophosphokinase
LKDFFWPRLCFFALIVINTAMSAGIVQSRLPVTLLGAGKSAVSDLDWICSIAPLLVAADGGANVAIAAGRVPDAVIGDFDSLDARVREVMPQDRLHHVAAQDSTDFEKCLERVAAPLILALGFTGARIDHELAVWNALARRRDLRCIVIGGEDIVFVAPPHLALDLAPGTRVSLFPMSAVKGRSTGLRWPIGGIDFAPDGLSGTSNEATGRVEIAVESGVMLVILARSLLPLVIAARAPLPAR